MQDHGGEGERYVNQLRADGYVVIPRVFSTDEIASFRSLLGKSQQRITKSGLFERDAKFPDLMMISGDVLTLEELESVDYIAFDARVVSWVKRLLGPEVAYHGDSTAQVGEGPRGFHKDNADRDDPTGVDWRGEYCVLRLGIYLQDHAVHSGGLKVRRHSHGYVSHHRGSSLNVASAPGDIVAWYLTTSHSGNAVRLRGLPELCWHPRLESLVPRWARVPEAMTRMSVFCTFGAPGPHLDHYVEYQSKRSDVQAHWRRCANGEAVTRLAARRGITLLRPGVEYGVQYVATSNG